MHGAAFVVAIALMASGCSTAPAARPAPTVTVQDSQFDAYRTFSMTPLKLVVDRTSGLMAYRDYVQLTMSAIRHKKTGEVRYLLNALVEYQNGWRFYSSASLPGGQVLPAAVAPKRSVGSCTSSGCSYYESIVFDIPAGYVAEHAGGFELRLNPGSGPAIELAVDKDHLTPLVEAAARP